MPKQSPKWKLEWDQLVGTHKYLRVRNYDKYQADFAPDYVKDHYNKDEDRGYYNQPGLQRWMMDWCRRQRGRLRHNLYSDPLATVARMNLTRRGDVAYAPCYLLALVACGFLVPTNDIDAVESKSNVSEGKVKKGKERKAEPLTPTEMSKQEDSNRDIGGLNEDGGMDL